MGFIGAALLLCFARGPWQKGWLGWSEGWSLRRRDLKPQGNDEEKIEEPRGSGGDLEPGSTPASDTAMSGEQGRGEDGRGAPYGGREGERNIIDEKPSGA